MGDALGVPPAPIFDDEAIYENEDPPREIEYCGLPLEEFTKEMILDVWLHLNGVELLRICAVSKNWNDWVTALGPEWWDRICQAYEDQVPEKLQDVIFAPFRSSTSYALSRALPTNKQIYRAYLTTLVVDAGHTIETEQMFDALPKPKIRRTRYFKEILAALTKAIPNDILFLRKGAFLLPNNYTFSKPITIVGEENEEHFLSSFITSNQVIFQPKTKDPLEVSVYSVCTNDMSVKNCSLKCHRCVTGPIHLKSDASAVLTACLIKETDEPLSLASGWKNLSVSANCRFKKVPDTKWFLSSANAVIDKMKACPADFELHGSLVKTLVCFMKISESAEVKKLLVTQVFPLLWGFFISKKVTTEKALLPLEDILETLEGDESMKEEVKKKDVIPLLQAMFEGQPVENPVIATEFCRLIRKANPSLATNPNLVADTLFDSLAKWANHKEVLIELLTTTWNFLYNAKPVLKYVLRNKCPQLLAIFVKYRDTDREILERCCGVLWNLPKDGAWIEEYRKQLFDEVLRATKYTTSTPYDSVLGVLYHGFSHETVRNLFVEYDGISILFDILETKPRKSIEKRILNIIDSLLHHDDTVHLMHSTISLLKKGTFLEWNRSAIFNTLACYAKKNPKVVPDVLVQLKMYISQGRVWNVKDIWRMIDALGTLALFHQDAPACQEILDQIKLALTAESLQEQNLSRIPKWIRWLDFCVQAKPGQIPSVPYCTPQIVVYTDNLTIRSMDGGFASAAFPISVSTGKWYYECQVFTTHIFQIGWVTNVSAFAWNGVDGVGVGDDQYSWGVDFNRLLVWNGDSSPYGDTKWKEDDIVGCYLDIENRLMSFSLNGKNYGHVCSNFNVVDSMTPGLSMSHRQECCFNFGSTAFKYPPKDGYLPLIQSQPDTRVQ